MTWLEENGKVPCKQRNTACRIDQRIVEEFGFQGTESTVRWLVAQVRGRQAEPFLTLTAT